MSVRTRRDLVILAAAVATVTLVTAIDAEAADAPTMSAAERSGGADPPSRSPSSTTTTAPPTTTTTTAPPEPEDPVEAAIARWFPEVEQRARDIAWCESRHDPEAVSPGGGNHGLFQINNVHRHDFPRVTGRAWGDALYEPEVNARFARWLYDREGWEPWACA